MVTSLDPSCKFGKVFNFVPIPHLISGKVTKFIVEVMGQNLKGSKTPRRGGLGILTDRDQRSWVFLNDPKNIFPLTENQKNTFPKAKS